MIVEFIDGRYALCDWEAGDEIALYVQRGRDLVPVRIGPWLRIPAGVVRVELTVPAELPRPLPGPVGWMIREPGATEDPRDDVPGFFSLVGRGHPGMTLVIEQHRPRTP